MQDLCSKNILFGETIKRETLFHVYSFSVVYVRCILLAYTLLGCIAGYAEDSYDVFLLEGSYV